MSTLKQRNPFRKPAWREYDRQRAREQRERQERLEQVMQPLLDWLIGQHEGNRRGAINLVRTQLLPPTIDAVCNALFDIIAKEWVGSSAQAKRSLVDLGKLAVQPILAKLSRSRMGSSLVVLVEVLREIGLGMGPTERVGLTTELVILQSRAKDVELQVAIGRTLGMFREADN